MVDFTSKVIPLLNARNVSLGTLKVSPEMLSESLVAQLRDEQLFTESGRLNGDIWGVWDRYVVWERNGEPRKTSITDVFAPLPHLTI